MGRRSEEDGDLRAFLRTLPLAFRAVLHDVHLVQFSLDPAEIRSLVPVPLPLRLFRGRAVVSLLNVVLRQLRPTFAPRLCAFSYRHIAFRVLLDDRGVVARGAAREGVARGITYAQSFTDRPLVALGGDWLTSYRLSTARMHADADGLALQHGRRTFAYETNGHGRPLPRDGAFADVEEARATVGAIDRAYAAHGRGRLWMTRIERPEWPLEDLAVTRFDMGFFASAKFECAFRVPKPVPYLWRAPVSVPAPRP